jgi:hypothetical protein
VALFWGHREMADLVAACFDEDGALTPQARAARGFYRRHRGFPDWQPSDDRHEILDEALVGAAKCNRVEVLEAAQWLIEHGADAALKDDLCKSDAVGTASYLGKAAVRDYLGSIRSGNRRAQRPQGLRIQCKAVLYTDHVRETHQRNPGSLHGGTPLGRTKS